MKYYAYDKKQDIHYRFEVYGHTSMFTGEFSHHVIAESRQGNEPYSFDDSDYVFCCYNAKEAAQYFAQQHYGVSLSR